MPEPPRQSDTDAMAPKKEPEGGKKNSRARNSRKSKIIEHPRSSAVHFTNREIGWLHFNRRVLAEAEDDRNPLLERLKYLAISASNLDEFFMKRVGGLKRQVVYGISPKSSDGQTPIQQLKAIREFVHPMLGLQNQIYEKLRSLLKNEGLHLLVWKDLAADEISWVRDYYSKNVFPVLTPLSVDPGHPFPFISNLSTSLGVTLKHPEREDRLFARIKIPKVLSTWVQLPSKKNDLRFISLLEIIKENLADLFPNMEVLSMTAFRLTRNADADRDEEDAEDLLEMIEEELKQRRFAEVVRLEHGSKPDPWILKFLQEELDLGDSDVYEHPGDLDLADLMQLYDLGFSKLKFPSFTPRIPKEIGDKELSLFSLLKTQDLLLHHPYESFGATVEKLISEAAVDPDVLAIKMTLYRTGDNSPFIKALIQAAESGKQVVCLIELKARFDEERNILWAQELENAGVHVVYGVVGLKTHAKTALVVRKELQELRCYVHIGTGNYNITTSKFYTDVGLLTSHPEIAADVVQFFNYLTGRSLKADYKHLLVAPVNMFQRFKEAILRESENAKKGLPSKIIAKFNNMEENDISLALYQASQSGVEIDLIVRGFCCARPGVKGLSENLRVRSIIGRFLEHSRIFYFRNAAQDPIDGEFYLGSADWMYRNLHARVEAIVPILNRPLKEKCWEILQICLRDQKQSWEMNSSGEYHRKKTSDPGAQQVFMSLTESRNEPIEEFGEET